MVIMVRKQVIVQRVLYQVMMTVFISSIISMLVMNSRIQYVMRNSDKIRLIVHKRYRTLLRSLRLCPQALGRSNLIHFQKSTQNAMKYTYCGSINSSADSSDGDSMSMYGEGVAILVSRQCKPQSTRTEGDKTDWVANRWWDGMTAFGV